MLLKKKILELKNAKTNLESLLESEMSTLMSLKNSQNKKVFQMTEDMSLIRNEWEKKCEEQVKNN